MVTAVEIDAGKAKPRAENTTVSDLHATHSLSWTQTDKALPVPVDLERPRDEVGGAQLRFPPETLDWQPLQVTGLKGRRYLLKIDDPEVGTFSGRQTRGGVPRPGAVGAAPCSRRSAGRWLT